MYPSASLGVQHSAPLGVQHSAPLKLFVERSRDEKSNAYTSTPRLRSGYNTRLRSNCSSSEAETRNPMHIPQPLGFARGADLGFARGALGSQTVRRAKPRRESYVYMYPSASLGVLTWASLGVPSASLGVQSQQPHRVDIIITTLELLSWYR